MEDWRRTAEAAAVQNLIDINMTMVAIQAIDVAHRDFALAAEACVRFRFGLLHQPRAGDPLPHLPTALEHVWFAILSTRRLSSYHAGSGHVFSIGAAGIGLQGIAPWWWQRWEGHRGDAAAHADMALQRLRSACSHGAAACDVVNLIIGSSLAFESAWGPAAEQLMRRAADELAMARAALERMRPAVVAEFSDAWMLLSR